jgi:hypothetical protein
VKNSREQLKKQYPNLYVVIEKILFDHDLIGVSFGDNTDEYAPEVDTIIPRLSSASNSEDVSIIIREEFIAWFDDIAKDIDEKRYQSMANDVWNAWQQYK